MKELFLIFFFSMIGIAEASLSFNFTRCAYSGDPTCLPGQTPPTASFAGIAGGYLAVVANGQFVGGYVAVSDPTAVTGAVVSKPSGIPYNIGEISLRGNFAADTYRVRAKVRNPVEQQRIWLKAGQTHGVNLGQGVSIPQANNIQDFIISPVGGLALNGDTALYIKSDSLIEFECVIVYPASTPNFTANCDASSASVVPDYTVYKLSGAAPTSCANSQFVNANTMQWSGFANTTDPAPTFKVLHDTTKFYFCLTQTDGDLRSVTSANDDSGLFNDDRIEMLWRNTISTAPKDANTFKFVANLLNAKWSANYPGDSSNIAQSLNEACTITLTGDLDLTADDTSYQIFCSLDAGFTITDGLLISADAMVGDKDGTGNTKRQAHTVTDGQINNPVGWGIWALSGTTVPGVTDSTPPIVGAPSFVGVTGSSFTAQSTVSDSGGASCCTITAKADTTTGTYTSYSLGPFSGTLTAGAGSVAVTGLSAGTSYKIRIRACDSAGNCTDSAEGTQATVAATAFYIAPNGTGTKASTSCADTSAATRCPLSQLFAASVVQAGDTWILKDGAYSITTGQTLNCSATHNNGTSLRPVIVKAQNERQAFLDASAGTTNNGDGSIIRVDSCSYWTFEGLRFQHGDFNSSANSIYHVTVINSNHITMRRNLFAFSNRFFNVHQLTVSNTVDSLIEENEFYYFHRYGLVVSNGSQRNVITRNYSHGRNYGSVASLGHYTHGCPQTTGGVSYRTYGSNGTAPQFNKFFNNISEDTCDGGGSDSASYNNFWEGNIVFNADRGVVSSNHGTFVLSSQNNLWKNHLVSAIANLGFSFRATVNAQCENCTLLTTGVKAGFSIDDDAGNIYTTGGSCLNCVTVGAGGTGYVIETAEVDQWSLNYTASFNNSPARSPSSGSNITNNVTLTSNPFSACKVFVPTGQLKGTGQGGADVGANILYKINDIGTLSTTKLWSSSTKKWNSAFIGASVNSNGLDTTTNSIRDMETRLHPTCTAWPAGY